MGKSSKSDEARGEMLEKSPESEGKSSKSDDHLVVSWNRGTPSHHLFLDGIFPNKNHPFWGTPMTMETSTSDAAMTAHLLEFFLRITEGSWYIGDIFDRCRACDEPQELIGTVKAFQYVSYFSLVNDSISSKYVVIICHTNLSMAYIQFTTTS